MRSRSSGSTSSGCGIAADHLLEEDALAVHVDVEDAAGAGHELEGDQHRRPPLDDARRQTGRVRRRPSGHAVLDAHAVGRPHRHAGSVPRGARVRAEARHRACASASRRRCPRSRPGRRAAPPGRCRRTHPARRPSRASAAARSGRSAGSRSRAARTAARGSGARRSARTRARRARPRRKAASSAPCTALAHAPEHPRAGRRRRRTARARRPAPRCRSDSRRPRPSSRGRSRCR